MPEDPEELTPESPKPDAPVKSKAKAAKSTTPEPEAPAAEVEKPVAEAAAEIAEPATEAGPVAEADEPAAKVEEPAAQAPAAKADEPAAEAPATQADEPAAAAPEAKADEAPAPAADAAAPAQEATEEASEAAAPAASAEGAAPVAAEGATPAAKGPKAKGKKASKKKEDAPAATTGEPAKVDISLDDTIEPIKVVKAKGSKGVTHGIAHVQASFNNTIVTLTDQRGAVIGWSSAGKCGFKGSRKSTAYAAQMVAQDACRQAMGHGLKEVEVRVKGPGAGRESAVRAMQAIGLEISTIRDVTPVPHNGCRPPKQRRV